MLLPKGPEKFPSGQLLATPGVLHRVPEDEIILALRRHSHGDWGNVCEEDRCMNESALNCGDRLFSVYYAKDGTKFWIITEADRSRTTVLLPEEY